MRRVASSSSSTHASNARRLTEVAKCQMDFFTRRAASAVSFSFITRNSRVFWSSRNARRPSSTAHSRSRRSTRKRSSSSPARSSSNRFNPLATGLSSSIAARVGETSRADSSVTPLRSSLGTPTRPRLGDADGEVFVSHRCDGAGDGGTIASGSTVRPSAASMDTYRCINASRRPSSFNSVVRYSSRPACSPGSRRGLNIGVRVPAAGPGVGGGVDAPDMPIASSVRGDSGSVSSSSFNSPLVFPGVLAG